MTWGELIARDVVPVLASLLLLVATTAIGIGAAYVRRRWQLDVPARTEQQFAALAAGAVAAAEQWGKAEVARIGKRPIGSARLEEALDWASQEARRRGLPELARAEMRRLIEAELGRRLLNGHAGGGGS